MGRSGSPKLHRSIDCMRLHIGWPLYLTLNNILALKSGLEITQGHL